MEGSLALLEVNRCKICAVSSMYLYAGCGGSEVFQGPPVCVDVLRRLLARLQTSTALLTTFP